MNMNKVLIIDDDEAILEAVRIAVESEGYEVKTLIDGENAKEYIRTYHPDLVLLDLLLSGKDGSEITRELKSEADLKTVPIVIVSAHPAARVTALESGADDFLAKPFDLDELFTLLKKHIA